MSLKRIPQSGVEGEIALREAAAGEFREIIGLLRQAVTTALGSGPNAFVPIEAVYADRVVIRDGDRLYSYPYIISDDNQVQLGNRQEVVTDHRSVREALEQQGGIRVLEALDDSGQRWLVRVIEGGWSKNGAYYSDSALREAAPKFNGARVFVKSDEEHLKGKGKDFRNLIGRLTEARFVSGGGKDKGQIQAVFEVLQSADGVAAKMREAYDRNMAQDLFGFSIDADARIRRGSIAGKSGRIVESITKVNSLDLIVEASAGGELLQLLEAVNEDELEMALHERMIEAVKKANGGALPEGLDVNNEEAVLEAYNKTLQHKEGADIPPGLIGAGSSGESQDDALHEAVDERFRMLEARSEMRTMISESRLPPFAKDRLRKDFDARDSFSVEQVREAIEHERAYLGRVTESGMVNGLGDGSVIEAGEDRADKIATMLDDFFDPAKPVMSIRECYVEITGDRRVTGLMQNCNPQRLREAVAGELREAVDSTTWGNVLGNSITRALIREYRTEGLWDDYRFLVDVVPVNDFRTQERTRVGGYGDLPDVAQNGSYDPLTSPNDEKVTYALSKRGGTETVSIEAIANDDVGVIQRIPVNMNSAAKRTLYKFVMGFIDANGAIYDTKALFHADHSNLGTAALDAPAFAAMRLAMAQQTEFDSTEPLGLVLRHLLVSSDQEEAAFDLFVRNTNNDETFVQSRKPTVHVVPHWTDANNWYGVADKSQLPLIELGFYGGNEEPEIFIQDNPSQGSLFTNDQINYKIRHIYNGAVKEFRGFQGNIVP